MATMAALGGVAGSTVSLLRATVHAVLVIPGGMQFLAGIHTLWVVMAAVLIRKFGAAMLTGVLQGSVEFLSGNPHGLFVLWYSGLAGLAVDLVFFLFRRHYSMATCALAGGLGSASNVLVIKLLGLLPPQGVASTALTVLALIAFASGVLFGGPLAWWLLQAIGHAGLAPLPSARPQTAVSRWPRVLPILGAVTIVLLVSLAWWLKPSRAGPRAVLETPKASTVPAPPIHDPL